MNAKEEFIEHVGKRIVVCAVVKIDGKVTASLLCGSNREEYDKFLSLIDRNYDDGYGRQELYGIIWYDDGTWSERREYDGLEWWEHMHCPEKPEYLRKRW